MIDPLYFTVKIFSNIYSYNYFAAMARTAIILKIILEESIEPARSYWKYTTC